MLVLQVGDPRDVVEVVVRSKHRRAVHHGISRDEDVQHAGCAVMPTSPEIALSAVMLRDEVPFVSRQSSQQPACRYIVQYR